MGEWERGGEWEMFALPISRRMRNTIKRLIVADWDDLRIQRVSQVVLFFILVYKIPDLLFLFLALFFSLFFEPWPDGV